jgi:hypothetical protein
MFSLSVDKIVERWRSASTFEKLSMSACASVGIAAAFFVWFHDDSDASITLSRRRVPPRRKATRIVDQIYAAWISSEIHEVNADKSSPFRRLISYFLLQISSVVADPSQVTKIDGGRYNKRVVNFVDVLDLEPGGFTETQYKRIDLDKTSLVASAIEEQVGSETMNRTIETISVLKSPLGVDNSPERNVLYHGFIVFNTGESYWSLEKTNEGVTVQRSNSFDEVAKMKLEVSRNSRSKRLDPVEIVQTDCAAVTVGELFQFIVALMARKYHLTHSNCKHFSSEIFNFAAETKTYFPSLGF